MRRETPHTFRAPSFRKLNELTDAALAAKLALRRVVRALRDLLPGSVDTISWWTSMPIVELVLSDRPAGDDIREQLAVSGLMRRLLPVLAVAELPRSGADYLRGRARQSVRTNRNHALAGGYRASELTDLPATFEALEQMRVNGVPHWAVDDLRSRAQRRLGRVWVVSDAQGHCRGLASLTVDVDVARVNAVHVVPGGDASNVRFLLSSTAFMALADEKVRYVVTDRPRKMSPGVNYLQDRLGYFPRRVRLGLRAEAW